MIEINLLPGEMRRKQSAKFRFPSLNRRLSLAIALAVLILPHLFIQFFIVTNTFILKRVEKALAAMQPQRQEIDSLNRQLEKMKAFEAVIAQVTTQRFLAAPKLNGISDALAQGVWLSEISLSPEACEIKGSCFSAASQELSLIGSFLNTMRADPYIAIHFTRLNLASVQRRKLGAAEVVDFTISSKSQSK